MPSITAAALAVAAAEVEADAAALEVAAERPLRLARGRQLLRRLHLDRLPEHAAAEEVPVEGPRALRRVARREHPRDGVAAGHQDLASRPSATAGT